MCPTGQIVRTWLDKFGQLMNETVHVIPAGIAGRHGEIFLAR